MLNNTIHARLLCYDLIIESCIIVVTIAGSPSLVAFNLDLDTAELILEFDNTVNASTVNGSAIILQSTVTRRPMEWWMLTATTTNSPSGRVISLQLSVEDTNEIKRIRSLCNSSQNCYITVTQFLVLDSAGVRNIPINDGSAVAVQIFTPDTTRPELWFWTLDMNTGIMVLHFSETVDPAMLRSSQFTIQDFSQATTYSLTNSVSPSEPGSIVQIQLSDDDLNGIKSNPGIGTHLNDTFLSVGDSGIVDMNGNSVVPIPGSFHIPPADFIFDFTSPELISFSLDITSGLLTLTFSETVEAATFNFSGITLVNGQVSTINGELRSNASYRLTDGSWPTFYTTVLQVQLTPQDLTAINAMDNLATSTNNTYITADPGSIYDTFYNSLVPISLANSLQVSELCRSCSTASGK